MKQLIEKKPKNKNCDESCGCNEAKNTNLSDSITSQNLKKPEEKNELDPTHFGDWQVNCRTIDF